MQVTITLDSGAFFDELVAGRSYAQLEVGYFGSGPGVSDIQVLADGDPVEINEYKVNGTIQVRHENSSGGAAGSIEVTGALAGSLLKKSDIYPTNTPGFYRDKFDCFLNFTSGRFCCSMVKERRFVEYDLAAYNKTGHDRTMKPVAHNVAVHFDLDEGDSLELRKEGQPPIFSTKKLPAGTLRVDIDIVADNTTAEKLYRHALDLSAHNKCWLPNQGDPPTLGSP